MTDTKANNRSPRHIEKRKDEERNQDWSPANLLPDPDPKEGIVFRWVRVSSMGQADPTNYSKKMREGWQPVPLEEVPELAHLSIDPSPKFEGKLEVGGLLLCKMPKKMADQRNEYYLQMSKDAQKSVDNSLMRESNPKMPMEKPTNTSSVSFGKGG